MEEKVEKDCEDEFEKMSSEVKKVQVIPPQSREELLKYSHQFTLDPKTANTQLRLSDSNHMVTNNLSLMPYYTPQRVLAPTPRCCAARVYPKPVTGKWSGPEVTAFP
ncbi:hypothetical protein HF521_019980 [Silurus meridionalis]|uniref:Uncharacterized protein n=2 Tax=Silurus meridionalis TaxID=175797 RepID=A0A8T0BMQ6_SILME|nr:hypothetical protein HF521_019980 [Silurus meridionalis]